MFFSSVVLIAMALGISGQLSTDTSLLTSASNTLISVVGTVNSYNGPANISHAPTTPTNNYLPAEEDMRYYNYYAQSAYCSDQLINLTCDICQYFKSDINAKNGVAVLKNTLLNTLAFVTVSDSRKEITVTFRGTIVDLRNYLLDATVFNPGFSDIRFHLGFYFATMSLYDDVIQCVGYQLQKHPTYKVVFIGHSLGGAMARLTLYFVKSTSQFPGVTTDLYTYGEPRVGNKAFADYFNKLPTPILNDVVPHVLPTSILGTAVLYDFYIQPQPEVWIQAIGLTYCDGNFYEDPACSDSVDPSYTSTDHSTYFDVVGNCSEFVTPATLPSNPPPLPTKILSFVGGAIHFLLGLLL